MLLKVDSEAKFDHFGLKNAHSKFCDEAFEFYRERGWASRPLPAELMRSKESQTSSKFYLKSVLVVGLDLSKPHFCESHRK